MWRLLLEDIILVKMEKQTEESAIVSIRRWTRFFYSLDWILLLVGRTYLLKCIYILNLVLFGLCGRGSIVGNKWNHKSYDTSFWDVPHHVPQVWLVKYSNDFFMSAWEIPHSIQSADYICEERVTIFPLTLFPVEFLGTWTFCRLLYSSAFMHPINNSSWMNVSCTSHKISLPSCAWGTTTNIGHMWYFFPMVYWLFRIQDYWVPQHNSCWGSFFYYCWVFGLYYLLFLELLQW